MVKSITSWVKRIDKQKMPIFQASINAIAQMAAKDETSASELASTILRDPSLSARILKFANSQFYRTTAAPSISTVSHAVVILGFEVVQELSLSLAIIDSLIGKDIRPDLAKSLAYSFLSAVQARSLAEEMGHTNLEEIFIAALLYDLGEMAFWCIADKGEVATLEETLRTNEPEQAQKLALGFRFKDLTWSLVQQWNIRSTLEDILKDETCSAEMTKIIHFGKELAVIATSKLEAPKESKKLKKIAKFTGMDSADLKDLLKNNIKLAAEMGHAYSPIILQYFSSKNNPLTKESDIPLAFPEPDALLQLKILRELSTMLQTKHDINLIMESLLEGIYRGVGMDRTLFALYNHGRSQLRAKFVLGSASDFLLEHFTFSVGQDPDNPFADVLFARKQAIWIQNTQITTYEPDIMHQIRTNLDVSSFFLAPILVNNHPVGVFYADRQPSKRTLGEDDFASFCHLSQQAGISIEHSSRRT